VGRAGPRRAAELPPVGFEERAPGQGEPVAAQSAAGEADDRVAGLHVCGKDSCPFDHADGEADEVELAGLHHAAVLGHLAAEQRTTRSAATIGDAGDDLVDRLRDELADGDVVEEEQRLGAVGGDVVDGHRDAVDPDRVVPAGELGDDRLRANAVGGRDEHRVVESVVREREQPAEAADVADDLGPERGADALLDELDGLLAGCGVDAGVGVGDGVALPVAPRHGSTRAVASGTAPGTRTFSTSRASLVSASGTGTGYSPLRQAVQNESALEPVAATSRSRSR
jgi:hypothetical protein